jgi:Glyoxalase-like domain
MTLAWEQTVVDAQEPRALGAWWANALGWVTTVDTEDEVEIRRAPDVEPGLLFIPVADAKVVKNRLHIDLRPDDQELEVARLVSLGAQRVDVGQGDVGWVVLADPEGNEFCVLGSRPVA